MIDRCRRRAFSLMEVVIAVSISVVAVLVVTEFLIYSSKIAQANLSQLHAGEASRRFYEHVAETVRRSTHVVVQSGGLSVLVTTVDGTVCSYTYVDADDTPATIMDNRVHFDPDTSNSGDDYDLVSGVTPGPQGWIFQPGTPYPVLNIRFRIGDPSADLSHVSNAVTGPGLQGVDVISSVSPRNLHLWGG